MPKSSMSASMVLDQGEPELELGSPGSARIISAVAQVTSHCLDVQSGVVDAVAAYRVHAVPPDKAYVEGESISTMLLAGMAQRELRLVRPTYGVSAGPGRGLLRAEAHAPPLGDSVGVFSGGPAGGRAPGHGDSPVGA
jgi:gamma-glutamyltranspeptidase/glutathione hydrolase